MTRARSFRDVRPDATRRGVWWAYDAGGKVLGSAYKVSWHDPGNVLGWMSAPERAGKDYGVARTKAGAVAWLYAPENRQRRYARGLVRSRSPMTVRLEPYVIHVGGDPDRAVPIPDHTMVTVDGRKRGVVHAMDDDPGMWWVNPGVVECGWDSPLADGVKRFTSFGHAVRWMTQRCDRVECVDCFKDDFLGSGSDG